MPKPKKHPPKHPPKHKSNGGGDQPQTVIFPAYTPPTGFEGTWDHGVNWETPPDIVLPSHSDGSTWLKLEVKYLSKPTTPDVALWLKQVLRFEIGEHLAEQALKLMRGRTYEFERFAQKVIKYLLETRRPKANHKKRANSRKPSPGKVSA